MSDARTVRDFSEFVPVKHPEFGEWECAYESWLYVWRHKGWELVEDPELPLSPEVGRVVPEDAPAPTGRAVPGTPPE